MKDKKSILSEVDIEALLNSPKVIKVDIVQKIGKYYTAGSFSDEQKKAAEKIIVSIARDEPDSNVRQIMSESIKESDDIPTEIVMLLAEDEAMVAVPVLQFSKVLTDDNLIYIIKNTGQLYFQSITKKVTVTVDH